MLEVVKHLRNLVPLASRLACGAFLPSPVLPNLFDISCKPFPLRVFREALRRACNGEPPESKGNIVQSILYGSTRTKPRHWWSWACFNVFLRLGFSFGAVLETMGEE